MEDILLLQLLKKKGIISDSDLHEFHELADINLQNMQIYPASEDTYTSESTHIEESKAKHIVSKMYHCSDGKKYMGERFSIQYAKDICVKYKDMLDSSIHYTDIYLAINSQYHNYCSLFKKWFKQDLEDKIVESSLIYWFKDDDYEGSKIYDYFKQS